jgi:hypothetical protein
VPLFGDRLGLDRRQQPPAVELALIGCPPPLPLRGGGYAGRLRNLAEDLGYESVVRELATRLAEKEAE